MYKGKFITLTALEPADAEQYRQWVNEPEIMQQVDRVLPVTVSAHAQWYTALLSNPTVVMFAVKYEAEFMGCVWLYGIDYRHRKAEVRIVLGNKSHQNKQFGLDTLKTISHFAFSHLNLHKVYAYVLGTNPRALKCFENAGFQREGLLREECYLAGQYVDMIRLALWR